IISKPIPQWYGEGKQNRWCLYYGMTPIAFLVCKQAWGDACMGAFDASAIVGFLLLVETELLLFASVFFLLGAIDEVGVDLAWLWLRLTRKVATRSVNRREYRKKPLRGPAA